MRQQILEEIRRKMGGWFGDQDGIFAGHPLDEKRAKEHLNLAAAHDISVDEIIELSLGYFHKKKYSVEHQEEQLKRIKKFFRKLR